MKVFAIGDLHFDSKKEKPMDIFGDNWLDHEDKIIRSWKNLASDDDLILIPGDISWAIKLEDAMKDLQIIDDLPGKKVLIRGNHDYWWATKKKLSSLNFKTIEFLVNDVYFNNKIIVCGVRAWDEVRVFNYSDINSVDTSKNKDELNKHIYNMEEKNSHIDNKKIFQRELNRFEISLKLTKNHNLYKVAMLHFPPFNSDKSPNEFVNLMKEYKIDKCIYGHLHGREGLKNVVEGNIEGIEFSCVSSDYLDFQLKEIVL